MRARSRASGRSRNTPCSSCGARST
jgi:hypothetical protein